MSDFDQGNHDFCKGISDAQFAYIEAERRVKDLKTDNDKLRELVRESLMDYRQYAEKYDLPPYLSDVNEHLDARLRELGIEVDE